MKTEGGVVIQREKVIILREVYKLGMFIDDYCPLTRSDGGSAFKVNIHSFSLV